MIAIFCWLVFSIVVALIGIFGLVILGKEVFEKIFFCGLIGIALSILAFLIFLIYLII